MAENVDDLVSIPLSIHPDVMLELSSAQWQLPLSNVGEEEDEKEDSNPIEFDVDGPPEVSAFLEKIKKKVAMQEGKMAASVRVSGFMSPPRTVTIKGANEREAAGIPLECKYFAFAYPLDCLTGMFDELVTREGRDEPWLNFLLFGGYVYFNASRQLVRSNAIVLTQAMARLELVGPFIPSQNAMEYLSDVERLRDVTLKPMLDAGFQRFGWVNPGERFGGYRLLADGTDAPGDGAFVYEHESGCSICYSLVKVDAVRKQRQKRLEEAAAAREAAVLVGQEPERGSPEYDTELFQREVGSVRFASAPEALSGAPPEALSGGASGAPISTMARPAMPSSLEQTVPAAATALHAKFGATMSQLATMSQATLDMGNKLRVDLDKWRRSDVEKWVRSHGASLVAYYTLGALTYGAFEGWDPLDSVYYLTATATTNGDEISPQSPAGRLFSCFYILLGITIIFSGLAPLAEYVLERVQRSLLDPLATSLAERSEDVLEAIERAAIRLQASTRKWPSWLGCISGPVSSAAGGVRAWANRHTGGAGARGLMLNNSLRKIDLAGRGEIAAKLPSSPPASPPAVDPDLGEISINLTFSPPASPPAADPSIALRLSPGGGPGGRPRVGGPGPGAPMRQKTAPAGALLRSTQPAQLALQSPRGAEFSHLPSAPEAKKAAAGMPTSGITSGKSSEPAGEGLVKSMAPDALQGTMKSYALALMLVLVVVALGMAIAMGVHEYSTIDALYWTIGCMTTAGGDLHADTNTLKMVYIIYMPIGAVTMLTAGRTVLISSQRRGITMDNFSLQLYDLLGREARRKADKHAKLREADFIVSVLLARKMVDSQTIEAIRKQFAVQFDTLVPTAEPAIDAQLVFDKLVRQKRVLDAGMRPKGEESRPMTAAFDDEDADAEKTATAYVDTSTEDKGFEEWFETYWTPSVEGATGSGADENDTRRASASGGYTKLMDA